MVRALSGEMHRILKEKTNLDTRGLYDPRVLMDIARLKEIARRKGRARALALLEEAEKRLFVDQYADLSDILGEDLSLLGLAAGNQEKVDKSLEEVFG